MSQKKAGPKARLNQERELRSQWEGVRSRRQRVHLVAETGPVETPVGAVAVEAAQRVVGRLHLVEDAHVAPDRHPGVVEVLDAVEHVGGLADCGVDVAVGEELLDVDRQEPARVGGHRHGCLVNLERIELRLRVLARALWRHHVDHALRIGGHRHAGQLRPHGAVVPGDLGFHLAAHGEGRDVLVLLLTVGRGRPVAHHVGAVDFGEGRDVADGAVDANRMPVQQFLGVGGCLVAGPVTAPQLVGRVRSHEVDPAAAHPVALSGVAVHARHVAAVGAHVDVELAVGVGQFVLDVTAFEVGAAAGAGVASQTAGPLRHGDAFGDRVEALLVLPQDRFPLEAAVVVLHQRPVVAGRVADQAVDVLQLLLTHLGAWHLAQPGVALGTALGEDLAAGVLRDADPCRDGVGAEVVDGVFLAEELAFGVDDRRRLTGPLIVLRVEKSLRLVLVAPETCRGALVVFEVLLVGVVRCDRRHRGQAEQSHQCDRVPNHVSLPGCLLKIRIAPAILAGNGRRRSVRRSRGSGSSPAPAAHPGANRSPNNRSCTSCSRA